jgi:hypothetical protein
MTQTSAKVPKKVKEKKQTPEERLEAMRYNHMMYGPTPGEMKPAVKKVDYGASYLKHPKFQSLMTAFRKGTAFKFEVTVKDHVCSIATDGSSLSFEGKVIFYARSLNKHEDNLLLDRAAMVQYQNNDALVHLAFAILRTFPELETPQLTYLHHQFYWGVETLDSAAADLGPNLLVGSFKHSKALDKNKK